MPAHTNPAGDIFGGWIMASMDAAAVMTTTRLVGGRAVTVAVSNIAFLRPVKVGDAVCFYTDVKRVGQTRRSHWMLKFGCSVMDATSASR
jgi:acyl-CoA thioesterase YciA